MFYFLIFFIKFIIIRSSLVIFIIHYFFLILSFIIKLLFSILCYYFFKINYRFFTLKKNQLSPLRRTGKLSSFGQAEISILIAHDLGSTAAQNIDCKFVKQVYTPVSIRWAHHYRGKSDHAIQAR